MTEAIVVPRRFCGPPTSGNGGYCAGLVAAHLHGSVEVTLRAPPPLDHALTLDCQAAGCTLLDAERVVVQGKSVALELDVPAAPSFEEAERWSKRFAGFTSHLFPECFVCGTARAEGDGLRIFAGPSDDGSRVAAPCVFSASHGEGGVVHTPIAWAALDCPGYFAAAEAAPALLGRITAELLALPRIGQRYIASGWPLGREGRKIHAGTALHDESGTLIGRARQTWIVLEA